MANDASGDQFAEIARSLSNEPGVTATLGHATATALTIVEGCDHAGISLVVNRREIKTVAETDEIVTRADKLQYELGEGPCLQSIWEHETVYSPDLRTEQRWPLWAPQVAEELGIRSVLALQLFVGPDSLGALNLFSNTPQAFMGADRASALALAAHIAVAMNSAQDLENMDSALTNRTVIGQAEGILMQAFGIPANQAFATLVRVSQARNIKLHVVAAEIVDRGIRPELFG